MVQNFKMCKFKYIEKIGLANLYSIHLLMLSGQYFCLSDRKCNKQWRTFTQTNKNAGWITQATSLNYTHFAFVLPFLPAHQWLGGEYLRGYRKPQICWLYSMTMTVSTEDKHAWRSSDLCTYRSRSLLLRNIPGWTFRWGRAHRMGCNSLQNSLGQCFCSEKVSPNSNSPHTSDHHPWNCRH